MVRWVRDPLPILFKDINNSNINQPNLGTRSEVSEHSKVTHNRHNRHNRQKGRERTLIATYYTLETRHKSPPRDTSSDV